MRDTVLVGWKDVVMGGLGITDYGLRKAVKSGRLKRVRLPGMAYGKFRREEVMALVNGVGGRNLR